MKTFRTVVIAALLAIWAFPATSLARPLPASRPVAAQPVAPVAVTNESAAAGEAKQLTQREQQSQDLQDFRGGAVYLYFGSGVALILLIILLVILI
jgi:hypothetical protein